MDRVKLVDVQSEFKASHEQQLIPIGVADASYWGVQLDGQGQLLLRVANEVHPISSCHAEQRGKTDLYILSPFILSQVLH